MKIVKIILLGIVGISALMLVIALLIPKDYTVTQSIIIERPQAEVFEYVKLIDNQKYYSIWVMEDPNSLMTTKGIDGTVGYISAWDSQNKNVGKGEQEIMKISNERIDVDLRFVRPFKSNAKASTTCKAVDATHTQVTNEFYGNSPFPMNLMIVFVKGMLGDAMKQNLNNLKGILEKK
ncbi:MAG TPA: SRPBCC family protein [Bacteroidia bacterium]|nr:SRPBCC family protein [Bacteroidia bacterium]